MSDPAQFSPAEVGRRYVEAVVARDHAGLLALFAEDAVWHGPVAPPTDGKAAIAELYQQVLANKPDIRMGNQISEGRHTVFEILGRDSGTGEWRIGAMDHITLDGEGRIATIAVYSPPRTA